MTESRRDVDVYLEQRDEQTYANSAFQNAFYAFLRFLQIGGVTSPDSALRSKFS